MVERIVEQHPCDILVVGDRGDEVEQLLLACRQLGYAPHHAPSYDLSADAFQRRRYNVVFYRDGKRGRWPRISQTDLCRIWLKVFASVAGGGSRSGKQSRRSAVSWWGYSA